MHDEDRTRDAYKTARCALELDGDDDQRHRCRTCGARVRVLPPADTCPLERRLMALTIAREADPEGLTWAVDEGLALQLVPTDADIGEAWRWTIGDSRNEWESGVGATAADAILKATRLESARSDALAAMSAAVDVAPEDSYLAAMTAVRIAREAGCTCSQPPTWPMWRSVRFRDPDSGLHIYNDREVATGEADHVLSEPALVVVQTHPEDCPALAELHGSPRVVRVEEGQPPIVVVILRDGEALDLS